MKSRGVEEMRGGDLACCDDGLGFADEMGEGAVLGGEERIGLEKFVENCGVGGGGGRGGGDFVCEGLILLLVCCCHEFLDLGGEVDLEFDKAHNMRVKFLNEPERCSTHEWQ